jgi:hypothetical protein
MVWVSRSGRMATIPVRLVTAWIIVCGISYATAHAESSFGKSVFSTLDDPDVRLRGYGWNAIENLGRVSGANELQTLRFETFLGEDGTGIKERIADLVKRARSKIATEKSPGANGSTAAADPEIKEFTQLAKAVPEIAALAANTPDIDKVVSANDFSAIKAASSRQRPRISLKTATEQDVREALQVLTAPLNDNKEAQLEAARNIAGDKLGPADLDALASLVADTIRDSEIRSRIAVALVRNGRPNEALSIADDLLARSGNDNRSYALDILTNLSLFYPAVGREAILGRAKTIVPFLSDTELFLNAAALLSQVNSNELADSISLELLKRVESGDGLVGSVCVYAQTLRRTPTWPIELALVARKALTNNEDRVKTAGCVILLELTPSETPILRDIALGSEPTDPAERRRRLTALQTEWDCIGRLNPDSLPRTVEDARKLIVTQAASLTDAIPFLSISGPALLSTWMERAEPLDLGSLFSRAYWIRWAFTRIPAAAGAAAIWLVALVCVILMSHSNTLRAFLLFHPLGKQLGAFGQVKALVFAVPALRRRFFVPYRSGMLGILALQDARTETDSAYYSGSGAAQLERGGIAAQLRDLDRRTLVREHPIAPSVVDALRDWKGRVLLVGPSGRGKTMFLKYHVLAPSSIREPAIFATAGSLGTQPLTTITAKFGGAIPDDGFLDSLIQSGRLDLYIDGLNEVDPETRAAITDFVTARPGANIFITTQPLERYPAEAKLFALLPLTRSQVLDFLVSRQNTLAPDSLLKGEAYRAQARAFVAEKLAEADAQEIVNDREGSERARALVERLSNPMDLQTIADLLSLGQRPDVWALQKQRHGLVDRRYRERTNNEQFPLMLFSRAVYEARRDGLPEIDQLRFPRVAELLLEEKQIQRYIAGDPSFKADGYVFRHDKIRDFYTYNAFIADAELRVLHAGDDQFSGVYDLLSVELPQREATELREFLAERALDRGDHRLSDRYLEGLRARRILERNDPDWLVQYDPQDVAADDVAVTELDLERAKTLEKLSAALAHIDAGRVATRIICATRSDALLAATSALFEEAGITPVGIGTGQRLLFEAADDFKFGVLGLAHYGQLPRRMIDAARSTLADLPNRPEPTLIVVNPEADLPPSERSTAAIAAVYDSLVGQGIAVCSAPDLLKYVRSAPETARNRIALLWSVL